MTFLLDTNVVSEWTKPRPAPRVTTWLDLVDEDQTYLSVVSISELTYGIEKLAAGKRRSTLGAWLAQELLPRFSGRIIAIDAPVAALSGKILASCRKRGQSLALADAFIAATAESYGSTLVTRNISDFKACVTNLFNPWS